MVENQAYLFLIFSITGILIGALFDIFRALRKSFKTSNIITYIEDIVFWLLTGTLIIYNIWYFNDGEIRIYMFLGIIIGILIYLLTLSSIFSKISLLIFNLLKKIIKIAIIPLKLIKKICTNISKKVKYFINFYNKRGKIEKSGE